MATIVTASICFNDACTKNEWFLSSVKIAYTLDAAVKHSLTRLATATNEVGLRFIRS